MPEYPLTVLVHDGPVARAYLGVLSAHGIIPDRIIYLAYKTHQASGKKLLPWLPQPFLRGALLAIHAGSLNHWPRVLLLHHPDIVKKIQASVASSLGLPLDLVEGAYGKLNFKRLGKQFEILVVNDLADPKLTATLADHGNGLVLFTGGGIVPKNLLSESGNRFLHIHPGFLPRLRGADCLLWSILIKGNPAATAFHMVPNLDEGDIVLPVELEKISVPLASTDRPDDQTLYRLAYSFIDPWIRAAVLDGLIKKGLLKSSALGTPQDTSKGITHHFMHEKIRALALSALFPEVEEP